MIFVTPAFNAVTRPEAGFTVATDGSELDHVPPVLPLLLYVAVAPIHKGLAPLIVPANTSGLTVIVKVLSEPVQVTEALVKAGVTVIVAVIAAVVVLVAVNTGILPVPLATSPIVVLLFVQVYVVPVTVLAKLIAVVAVALQTTRFAGCVTFETGFTIMLYVKDAPAQVAIPVVVATAT